MHSRPWIGTRFCSFLSTSLPYPLPVFPLLPTLKNGSPQDSPWAVFHLLSVRSPRAPSLSQSLQSSFTRLGSFPSAPNLCIGHLQCRRFGLNPWVGKIPWRKAWQPTPVFLAGEFPWTEEPGKLQSMGSQRVGHD